VLCALLWYQNSPKALRVLHKHLLSSEPLATCRKLTKAAGLDADCAFKDIKVAITGEGVCWSHLKVCARPCGRLDIYVIGVPCQEFSVLSKTRFNDDAQKIMAKDSTADLVEGFFAQLLSGV
jgi:site-specific DNA-cytosine methylase